MIDLFKPPTVGTPDGLRAVSKEELKKRQIEMADSMRNAYPSGGLYGLMRGHDEAQSVYNQQMRTMLDNVGKPKKRTIWQRLQLWWASR